MLPVKKVVSPGSVVRRRDARAAAVGERAIRGAAGRGARAGGAAAGRVGGGGGRGGRRAATGGGEPAARRRSAPRASPAYRDGADLLAGARGAAGAGAFVAAAGARGRGRRRPSRRCARVSPPGGGRSCSCRRRSRCRRPRAAIVEAFGERVRRCSSAGRSGRGTGRGSRSRAGALRRRGGHASGGVRAGRRPRARSACRARAIRRIARTGRRTTTCATSRWRGPARRAPCACSRRSARRRRPPRSASPRSRRRRGGGRRSRSCAPGPEGRAPRLVRALRETHARRSCFSPLPGYGIARSAASCGQPAACAACGGLLRSEEGVVRCVVCEAPGPVRACAGRTTSGSGAAARSGSRSGRPRVAPVPVRRLARGRARACRGDGEILVGGPDDVRDLGPGGLDLVAILDADLAERRPGSRRSRARAHDVDGGGRLGAARRAARSCRPRTRRPGRPGAGARQPRSVPRGRGETARGGGVPGGVGGVPRRRVRRARRRSSPRCDRSRCWPRPSEDQTVCLLALEPGRVPAFGRAVRELAAREVVTRVEAEPHL